MLDVSIVDGSGETEHPYSKSSEITNSRASFMARLLVRAPNLAFRPHLATFRQKLMIGNGDRPVRTESEFGGGRELGGAVGMGL